MKDRRISQLFVSALCALALLVMPMGAIAEGEVLSEAVSPVIITEVQTGGLTASDEFVELYNTSADPVDISGWQIRYANASAAADATTLLGEVTKQGQEPIILPGHSYFVFHTSSITLPEGVAGQVYVAGLSKSDKTIALFARDEPVCQMDVQDAVAWETAAGTTLGEGTAISATNSGTHILLQRYLDSNGDYVDTNDNAQDFMLAAGTPGADNPALAQPGSGSGLASNSPLLSFPASACSVPEPPIEDPPVPNEGLAPLEITEILPNPDAPFLEPDDEFIELFNPNDQPFELAGYTIEVGVASKIRYTFTAGTIAPQTYQAFYFPETNARLVNSNGQVRFFDPSDALLDETPQYAAAGGNKSWALIDGTWQWSPAPTPNEANELGEDPTPIPPVTQPPNNGLTAPQFTELLPAPSTGQLEFIELYNPNDSAFDLGGYVLETGTTTKYRFTFAAGTTLAPKTYAAFFADQTTVTLANKSGQARLIDPSGAVIAESLPYSDAKSNQAWIFIDDIWQWSTAPTPNAANSLVAPAVKAKSVASAKTKKQTSSAKTTKPKNDKESEKDNSALLASTKPNDPLHPGVLAGIAAFALLYGAYEYRNDVASRIRQFRANRAARAAAGPGTKGR